MHYNSDISASRKELPRSEAPLSDAERGAVVGEFQNWVFEQLGQLPSVQKQLFKRFKGPDFNVTGKDPEFEVGIYRLSLRDNIIGNWHVDDTTESAERQLLLRVRPVTDTGNPSDYFTVYSLCEYEGCPTTNSIERYTDGVLQFYPTDEIVATLIVDPTGVVDSAKQALTRVLFGSTSTEQTPEIPSQ